MGGEFEQDIVMMACLCSVASGTSAGKTQRTGGVFENEHSPQCFQLHVCVKINSSGPESCLENPMDRGAWWAPSIRLQSQTRLSDSLFHSHLDVREGEGLERGWVRGQQN